MKEKVDKFKSALVELKKLKQKERSEEKEFLKKRESLGEKYSGGEDDYDEYSQYNKERKKLNYQRDLSKKELGRKKTTARINVVSGYVERTGERLGSAVASQFKKPLLKKPSVSIKKIPATKILKQYANSGYSMFKSEGRSYQPQEQPIQDNRSMFFQETLNRERQNNRGWL